jgi:hypothetical protein
MKARDFPSYRLRHWLRMRRLRRRFPWRFHNDVVMAAPERDEDVVALPPSDVFDRRDAS